jgi:hypothetical protein
MVFCPQCYAGIGPLVPTSVTVPTSQPEVAAAPRISIGALLAIFGGVIILFGTVVIGINAFPQWVTFLQSWWTGVTLVALTVLGVMSGMIVLLGAAIMCLPNYEKVGAALVVAFAAVSLFVMGGFFAGFILGIVGAILGTLKR